MLARIVTALAELGDPFQSLVNARNIASGEGLHGGREGNRHVVGLAQLRLDVGAAPHSERA